MKNPVALALAACAAAFPVSIAVGNIALGLLTAALAHRALADRGRIAAAWKAEPALAAALLYAAAGLLCAAASETPGPSIRAALKDFHRPWALAAFVAATVLEPATPVLASFGLSLGAMALFGSFQTIASIGRAPLLARAHAFTHPVVFGEIMALAALGGLCLLLRPGERDEHGQGGRPRARPAAFAVLAITALTLSQTRMALFAAGVGFAAVVLLEPRARRWSLAALGLLAAAVVLWELAPTGGRTLSSLFHYDPSSPHQARWALWDAAWRMFRDHPWLGVGPGGYRRLFETYRPAPVAGELGWGSAHSLYLHQLAERGLLGAAALAAFLGVLAARAFAAGRRRVDARSLWAASATAALLVMSLTETALQGEQFASIFLLIWAWGVAPPGGAPEKG